MKSSGDGKGFFIEPTVFTDVTTEMRIYRGEIFGPFAVVARFDTDDEAIEMANDSTYSWEVLFSRKIWHRPIRLRAEWRLEPCGSIPVMTGIGVSHVVGSSRAELGASWERLVSMRIRALRLFTLM